MPKKQADEQSKKGKGKPRQRKAAAPHRTSPRKKRTMEPISDEESHEEQVPTEEPVPHTEEPAVSHLPSSQASKRRRKDPEFPMDIMKKIAEFYEGNPLFYDISHEKHKNTKLKESLLLDFSNSIDVPVEDITRHFTNMRTDHFKLRNIKKTTPSGSGAPPILTPLQNLKISGYAFLDPFHRPRTGKSDTCGHILVPGGDQSDSDGGSESVSVSMSTQEEPGPSTSKGRSKLSKSKSSGIQEVLLKFLEKSAESAKQAEEKVQAQLSQRPERAAWADWLVSIQSEIPDHLYRQYQAESFWLAMKYMSGQVQPAQPQQQPQPQPQHPPLMTSYAQTAQLVPPPPQQHYYSLRPLASKPQAMAQQQTNQPPQPQPQSTLQYPPRVQSVPSQRTSLESLLCGISPNTPSMIGQAFTLAGLDNLTSSLQAGDSSTTMETAQTHEPRTTQVLAEAHETLNESPDPDVQNDG